MSPKLPAANLAANTTAPDTTTAASTCCPSNRPAPVDFNGKARHAYHGDRHTTDRMTVTGTIMTAVSKAVSDPATEINSPRITPKGTQAPRYSSEAFQLCRRGCIKYAPSVTDFQATENRCASDHEGHR